jgi:hypothetical protein
MVYVIQTLCVLLAPLPGEDDGFLNVHYHLLIYWMS